jgi:hypothetical protein
MSTLKSQFDAKKDDNYLGASLRFMTADLRGDFTVAAQADFDVIKSHAGASLKVAKYVDKIESAVKKQPGTRHKPPTLGM